MTAPITVTDLVDQVRDQTDEFSVANVTDSDIIQALNRGQSQAVNILARHYPDPYLEDTSLTLVSGQVEYDLPEGVFEDRLESIEIVNSNRTYPLTRIKFRDIHKYSINTTVAIPQVYTIVGRKLQIYPAPSGTYPAVLWCMRSPQSLVPVRGRIENVDIANNQLYITGLSSSVTTTTDDLASYVNIIDATTGEVKATMQVKTITGNSVKFKSMQSGRRSSIYNQAIVYEIPDNVEVDDYICLASGTCVPFFGEGITNFLIQYAVAEVRRRLEDNPDIEQRVLAEFERRVERQWVGREVQQRVARRSPNWISKRRSRRYVPRG